MDQYSLRTEAVSLESSDIASSSRLSAAAVDADWPVPAVFGRLLFGSEAQRWSMHKQVPKKAHAKVGSSISGGWVASHGAQLSLEKLGMLPIVGMGTLARRGASGTSPSCGSGRARFVERCVPIGMVDMVGMARAATLAVIVDCRGVWKTGIGIIGFYGGRDWYG